MITPQPLKPGDTIAIVSPAGALRDTSIIEGARATLAGWGLNAVTAPHALCRNGYYSAAKSERIEDFTTLLADENVKAILCSYGGYGCVHLLDAISPIIKEHPKWVVGMSDCCALHAAIFNAGIASVHGPQCRHLATSGSDKSSQYLRDILFGKKPQYHIGHHPLNIEGESRGTLVGGNLSVICSLTGTPYSPIRDGIVLFIEDINEEAHRIERMLYTLKLSGALASIKGLIVGDFLHCRENIALGGTIYELIHNIAADYNFPVCFGFPAGHSAVNYPLIHGGEVKFIVSSSGVELSFL